MRNNLCIRRRMLIFLIVGLFYLSLHPSPMRVSNIEVTSSQRVHNTNTGYDYVSIQDAIDDPNTLGGHTIIVDSGVFPERIRIYKSLMIYGAGSETTVIDGGGFGSVIHINVSNVRFCGFTVKNSGVDFLNAGIFVDYCSNVNVSNNIVTSCRYGIYVFHSVSSTLKYNNVSMNYEDGIWLYYSGNNTLTGNRMEDNKYNFGVFGQGFAEFNNTIDASNLVDQNPIRYIVGVSDVVLDHTMEIGGLYLINAVNVTVRGLNLSNNGHGVFCWNATSCIIENVTAVHSNYGIVLQKSVENVISGNHCPDNWVGVLLEDSDHNAVKNNLALNNEKGFSLYESSYNILRGNTISGNLYGVRFFASGSNKAYHNNLIGNTIQVDLVNSHDNDWDNGEEGNFWSYYAGSDLNKDGIGDTSHDVGGDLDRYPLMGKYYEFEVVSQNQTTFSISVVSNSLITGLIYEEAGDEGLAVLSFNVMAEDEEFAFCRVLVPEVLLNGPFTVRAGDSLEFNATLRSLSTASNTHVLLYFSYDSTVHSIAIIGTATNSTLFLQRYVILALSITGLSLCFFVSYVVLKRRTRKERCV